MIPLPEQDLARIVRATGALWAPLRGGRVLITGATGFFGVWLLESLLAVNRAQGLGLKLFAQSRDPARFLTRRPHLGTGSGIRWVRAAPDQLNAADLRAADETGDGGLEAIIHLVTEADGDAIREQPDKAAVAIVGSTRRALELARETRAPRFLYTSSGAVYARPPGGGIHQPSETAALSAGVTDPAAGYAFSGGLKLQAEELCRAFAREHGLGATIARCFTFVGPGMPLQGKFAMGNFLDAALRGRDLVIRGDGTPVRSYLHAVDLTVWLWTVLWRGGAGQAYNVGSEHAVSLHDAAATVRREIAPALGIEVLGQTPANSPLDYYVPDTARAQSELGLRESIPLDEAVRRTADWFRQCERR